MSRMYPVLVLVTLVACSDPATGPTARRVKPLAEVSHNDQRISFEESGVFPVPRGCTGEPVQWTIRQEMHLHETIDANGGFHGSSQFHDQGSYGIGLVTGAMYRLAETVNESFNMQADQLPTNDTAIFHRRFISQGSLNNFRVLNIFHYTIDANGVMTSFKETSERVCD